MGHKFGLAQCFGQRSGNVFVKNYREGNCSKKINVTVIIKVKTSTFDTKLMDYRKMDYIKNYRNLN